LAIDGLALIAQAAKQEFHRSAGLSEYLLWNIFLQICQWWGDDPNLPAPDFSAIQSQLPGPLKTWLATDRSFRDPDCIAEALTAVRDALH
jgi:hypothetical protein